MTLLSIGQVAEQNGVAPKLVSDLLYAGRLDKSRCPMVGGRHLITADYAPEVARVLREVKQKRARRAAAGAK